MVKTKAELLKVYGRPTLQPDLISNQKRSSVKDVDGTELTNEKIMKNKLAYKNMRNYARNLLIENRIEPGKEIEENKLDLQK